MAGGGKGGFLQVASCAPGTLRVNTGNLEVAATQAPVVLEGKLAFIKFLNVSDEHWAISPITLFQREV